MTSWPGGLVTLDDDPTGTQHAAGASLLFDLEHNSLRSCLTENPPQPDGRLVYRLHPDQCRDAAHRPARQVSWNSFMLPLVMLAGSGVQTAPLCLATFQSGHVDDIPGLAASAVFVLIPVVIIYIFAQRHFIRGFTEGGLKA
jgi:hypothetical protein